MLLPFFPQESDPFQEDLATECIIGTAQLYLQPLAYLVEVREQLTVSDYAGREVGILNIEMSPAQPDTGEPFAEHEDVYIDSPQEMLGKPFAFVLAIPGARGLPAKFTVSRGGKETIYCLLIIALEGL